MEIVDNRTRIMDYYARYIHNERGSIHNSSLVADFVIHSIVSVLQIYRNE